MPKGMKRQKEIGRSRKVGPLSETRLHQQTHHCRPRKEWEKGSRSAQIRFNTGDAQRLKKPVQPSETCPIAEVNHRKKRLCRSATANHLNLLAEP